MKKIVLLLLIFSFILLSGCDSNNSSGPNLEDEQICYMLLYQNWNSTEGYYVFDTFRGYLSELNKPIKGQSYTVFSHEFNTFNTGIESLISQTFSSFDWTSNQMDNVKQSFLQNSTIPVSITTNIGNLSGEVEKVSTMLESVQINSEDYSTVSLNKNESAEITWNYLSGSPNKIIVLAWYYSWIEDGSEKTGVMYVAETVLEGTKTSYIINESLLMYDGLLRIGLIPVNGSYTLGENTDVSSRVPNMDGTGAGYFYVMGQELFTQGITVGTINQSPDLQNNISTIKTTEQIRTKTYRILTLQNKQ